MLKKKLLIPLLILVQTESISAELSWGFKSPAFNGNGYSSHVLSTEQLLFNRQSEIRDKAEAEERRLERELENSTLNKFVKNLESRIYATLSKQMVDSMFADCTDNCSNSGTADIEGSTISWIKDPVTGEITLTISNDDGTTEITIPGAGDFTF